MGTVALLLLGGLASAGEASPSPGSAAPFVGSPDGVEIGFTDATVRIRNTGADPLLLDGIALVDPRGWTVRGEVPSVVDPGAEIAVDLAQPGHAQWPATILVRTGSGSGMIHPEGLPGYAGIDAIGPADRAIVALGGRAAESCADEGGTAEDQWISVAVRVGTERRATAVWIAGSGRRSGAVEQCVVDVVRAVRYPRFDHPHDQLLILSFPAARQASPFVVKRREEDALVDAITVVNPTRSPIVLEAVDVVDGDGMRVDFEGPVRIPAERQRTLAVRGGPGPDAQLLLRTSIGVQVEPSWQPAKPGGALLQADIDRVVGAAEERVQACRTDPKVAGAVSVRFSVADDGAVVDASIKATSLPSGSVEQCVLDEVRALRFPAPTGGGPVPVATGFVFARR